MTWPSTVGVSAVVNERMTRMTWQGRTFLVPARATLTFTGEGEHPDATFVCELVDGVPAVYNLSVRAKPGGRPVRDVDLRSLSLESLAIQAFLDSADEIVEREDGAWQIVHPTPTTDEDATWALRSQMFDAQKGPRPPSSSVLEQVAAIYRKHIGGAPAIAVKEALGVSLSTAHRRIKQAEEAGLLPATTPGKKRRG